MTIPNLYLINDVRAPRDFTLLSFSGFKKSDVYKAFIKTLVKPNVSLAIDYSVELLLSCQLNILIEKILIFSCKHIHIHNPNLFLIFEELFNFTVHNGINTKNAINNQHLRHVICEIVVCAANSPKTKFDSLPKITKKDFDNQYLFKKFKAKDNTILAKYSHKDDPIELRIIINELYWNIKHKNKESSMYFLSWIIAYDKRNKTKDKQKKLKIVKRTIPTLHDRHCDDLTILIWQILIGEFGYNKYVEALSNMAFMNFKRTKSIIMIYCCIQFLCSINIDTNKDPYINRSLCIQAMSKINFVYANKKQYEETEKRTNIDFKEKKKKKPNTKEDQSVSEAIERWETLDNIFLNNY